MQLPEDFGKNLALKLLNELSYESTVDNFMQSAALLLMACSISKEHSRI